MVSPSLVVMVEGGTGWLGDASGGGGLVVVLMAAAAVWKTFGLTMSLRSHSLFLAVK